MVVNIIDNLLLRKIRISNSLTFSCGTYLFSMKPQWTSSHCIITGIIFKGTIKMQKVSMKVLVDIISTIENFNPENGIS